MPIPSSTAQVADSHLPVRVVALLTALALLSLGLVPPSVAAVPGHLVVSEVVTGGASASDELIEIYNPSAAALPLEGLELIYVTSSGATISRRAAWELGAPAVKSGGHVLVANEAGAYAAIADAVYASGMAATGGSVALRIQGASTAIDAVGWGTAASTWLEGAPTAAPPAGSSIERLPGGALGSTVDTNANAADFVVRTLPDPQNSGSPPVPEPSGTPAPTPPGEPSPSQIPDPTPDPTPTPVASAEPTPTATAMPAEPMPIADARALPDGATATVEGTALTASDFGDGGGYVADGSGGIAVLLEAGTFARRDRVTVTGTIDDRFAQRTLRADAAASVAGGDPMSAVVRPTGAVDESVEGILVRVEGQIDGGPTILAGGLAFDVDDGSGAARVVVGAGTGIDTAGWTDGRPVSVTGVVGQRDSSGTGVEGYRVQPRDSDDVALGAQPSPTPSASPGSPGESSTPAVSPSPAPGSVSTVAQARAAAKNARLTVRGLVTLGSGTVDPQSAVVQDATGAILLRLGDEARSLTMGQLVEVEGVRSTKSGMESLRVASPARVLGSAPDPTPRTLRTGDAGEPAEAHLVVARGALVTSARRASSGTVSFEIDDGSGPLRVVAGAGLAVDRDPLTAGTWVEVRGVLGQETSGSRPQEGYRIWPRTAADVRILAAAADGATGPGSAVAGSGGEGIGASASGAGAGPSLDAVDSPDLGDLRVGATLVAGPWTELGVAGLLWDGSRLVGVDSASRDRLQRTLGPRRPPVAMELAHLRAVDTHQRLGIAVVALGSDPADTVVASAAAAPPRSSLPSAAEPASWIAVVGRLVANGDRRAVRLDGREVPIEWLCRSEAPDVRGSVAVTGVGTGDPARILVPCGGIRPAPALTRPAAKPMAAASAIGASEPMAAVGGSGAWADRRVPAAALLAAGLALLGLAALLRSRMGDEREPRPDAVLEPVSAPVGGPPQLTLVRVPEEPGS